MHVMRYLIPLFAACSAVPAAAELPQGVQAMIDAALETGDAKTVKTVIDLARKTHPDDSAQLSKILAGFNQQQAQKAAREEARKEREIRQAGLFDNWSGSGQLGASRTTGNSSNMGISAGLKLKRSGIDWLHKFAAQVDYQRSNGRTTREQYRVTYEPNYEISDTLFIFGLGQYERDRFQGFNARYAISGGIGHRILQTKNITFNVQGGPAFRQTERINGLNESELSGFLSTDFDWRILKNLKLSQELNAFIQSANSTFSSETRLQAKIASNFSVGLNYSVEIDTDPPPGAARTDTLSRVTLIYDF